MPVNENQMIVTREDEDLVVRDEEHRMIVSRNDGHTDEYIARVAAGLQAILDHRAQERQAKASEAEECEAGVRALVAEAGMPKLGLNDALITKACTNLYDAGHRAKSTVPAEPRPFQVGDVVRVSDDAMTSATCSEESGPSLGRGQDGRVDCAESHAGEVRVLALDGSAVWAPQARFLTLITPAAKS